MIDQNWSKKNKNRMKDSKICSPRNKKLKNNSKM